MSEQEKCGAINDCLKGTQYAGLVLHTCQLPKDHDGLHAEYGASREGAATGLVTQWSDDGKHS